MSYCSDNLGLGTAVCVLLMSMDSYFTSRKKLGLAVIKFHKTRSNYEAEVTLLASRWQDEKLYCVFFTLIMSNYEYFICRFFPLPLCLFAYVWTSKWTFQQYSAPQQEPNLKASDQGVTVYLWLHRMLKRPTTVWTLWQCVLRLS